METGRRRQTRCAGVLMAMVMWLGGLAAAPAQQPVRQVLPSPTPFVDAREAADVGPIGLALSVVGRTVGVPVILHAVRGTSSAPLSAVVIENAGARSLAAVILSITWVPPDGLARRRLLTMPVSIASGVTTRVALRAEEAAKRLSGAAGVVEVAAVGVSFADGGRLLVSPGLVWATGQELVACADATWQAQPAGTDAPDLTTGALVRCQPDGQWVALDGDRAR